MDAITRFRVSALVAGIIFLAGYCIVLLIPGGGDVDAEDFTDFYDSDGKRNLAFLLLIALVLGSLAMVWFFTELRTFLPAGALTSVGYASAMIGAALVIAGGGIMAAPLGVQMNSDSDFVGIPIAHTFAQAGLAVMLLGGMTAFLLATLLTSLALRAGNLVPQWVWIVGFVVAIVMLGSFIWAPGVVFPLWVILLGLVGVGTRRGEERLT
ncbi:MAG: hypothetical protein ACR2HN_03435 [Tepidiformaceae bacterium]